MDGHIHPIEYHKPVHTADQMNKKRNFFRTILAFMLDMLPIILGLLIATGINEWRDYRHHREEERIYLKKIQQSIVQERKSFVEQKQQYDELVKAGLFIQENLVRSNLDHITLYPAINQFLNEPRPITNNIGYVMMQNAGKIGLISDQEILDQLISIYEFQLPTLEKMVDGYIDRRRNQLMPIIIKNYSIAMWSDKGDHLNYMKKLLNSIEYRNVMVTIVSKNIPESYSKIIEAFDRLNQSIDRFLQKNRT